MSANKKPNVSDKKKGDVYGARGHHCNEGSSYRHELVGVADDELLLALSHDQRLLLHLLRSLFVQVTEALLDDGGLHATQCEIDDTHTNARAFGRL